MQMNSSYEKIHGFMRILGSIPDLSGKMSNRMFLHVF